MIHVSRNGADQGTFSPDQINQLLATGQLLPGDLAWQEGMAEWQPLITLPGIQGPGAPTPAPPPIPGAYAPPHSPVAPMYSGGPPTSTSGLAVASMVLGILALLLFFTHVFAFILALLAIIFGHISRGTIHRSGGRIGGAGMSLAGLITGYIALIIVTVILIALGFFVKAAYDEAKSNPEVRNKFEEVFRRELDKQKEKAPE